jgi:bacterioferritin-associated ferredoxin
LLTLILMLWRNSRPHRDRTRPLYVCICNGITDHDIRAAAEAGCGSLSELTMRTGVGACCGTCMETAGALLEAYRPAAAGVVALPVLQRAA